MQLGINEAAILQLAKDLPPRVVGVTRTIPKGLHVRAYLKGFLLAKLVEHGAL